METFKPHPLLVVALNAMVFVVAVVATCVTWSFIFGFVAKLIG